MSSLLLRGFDLRPPPPTLFFSLPIIGAPNLTLCLFSDKGLPSYLDLIDSEDMPPLMLGVVGVFGVRTEEDSPTLYLTELTELLLPVESVSESRLRNLVDSEEFV